MSPERGLQGGGGIIASVFFNIAGNKEQIVIDVLVSQSESGLSLRLLVRMCLRSSVCRSASVPVSRLNECAFVCTCVEIFYRI